MSIESAMTQYWQSAPALHAQVGARIFPITAAQTAVLPYITWQRLSWIPTYHMVGRSNMLELTLQLDIWGRSSPEVERIAAAVLVATDAAYQRIIYEIDIRQMTILNDIDVPELPDDGGQTGVFHRAIDLDIWYRIIT